MYNRLALWKPYNLGWYKEWEHLNDFYSEHRNVLLTLIIMFRAHNNALFHSTNNRLVKIRMAELDYYSAFYFTFGRQAAVISGFVYSALTQVTFPMNNTCIIVNINKRYFF